MFTSTLCPTITTRLFTQWKYNVDSLILLYLYVMSRITYLTLTSLPLSLPLQYIYTILYILLSIHLPLLPLIPIPIHTPLLLSPIFLLYMSHITLLLLLSCLYTHNTTTLHLSPFYFLLFFIYFLYIISSLLSLLNHTTQTYINTHTFT